MEHNGFDDAVRTMRVTQSFRDDAGVRRKARKDLRRKIKSGDTPPWMAEALAKMKATFPEDQPLRCRSSTNNEDLPGFSGAGLYGSYTHHPD